MTEYKLNTYIEWTAEDRAKGECPVPMGSDVTVWFYDMDPDRGIEDISYDWGNCSRYITAYLIHSVPREPIVRWLVVGESHNGLCYRTEALALQSASYTGRVVKMVEEV